MTDAKLYVVATPIGNLEDMTPRAKRILEECSVILCEDTRDAGRFLQQLGLAKKRLLSYHDHNEEGRVSQIIDILKSGEDVALISDAGTPTISDPGYRIIRACQENMISVNTAPGACAAIAALSISGMPTDRFLFEGFLPPKGQKREDRIKACLDSGCTVILYESKYKIQKLIDSIALYAAQREVFIARELTKMHEECVRGTAVEIKEIIASKSPKGEYVVVLSK